MNLHAKRLARGSLPDALRESAPVGSGVEGWACTGCTGSAARSTFMGVQAEACAGAGCAGCTGQLPTAAAATPGNARLPACGPGARLQTGNCGDGRRAGDPVHELGACRLLGAGAVGAAPCRCTRRGDGARATMPPASRGCSVTVGAGGPRPADTSTAGEPSPLSCTFRGEESACESKPGEALREDALLSEQMLSEPRLADLAEPASVLPSEAALCGLP
mmetsp:Transcript_39033/g.111392  ORF Transcript_39033/g.111392 Transcript_39033/m.111392 type:complete len:219 (+) Transcript_39033:51-707(+)